MTVFDRIADLVLVSVLATMFASGCWARDSEGLQATEYETTFSYPVLSGRPPDNDQPTEGSGWRRCELDNGPLRCGPELACDMFRNRCIAPCADGDCCEGVVCPSPSVCAQTVGRCGTPAGPRCFDMGTTWWTGRDVSSRASMAASAPQPVMFVVHNRRGSPLYFQSTAHQQLIRFDLYVSYGDGERRLELAENHFCPSPCPAHGPHLELDCGRPSRFVERVPAGADVGFSWSGTEEIWNLRVCAQPAGRYCQVTRFSLPGSYSVEVCAHTAIEGGDPTTEDHNRLAEALLSGERECRRVAFDYPALAPVDIHFGT